jgi:hypothetical protein
MTNLKGRPGCTDAKSGRPLRHRKRINPNKRTTYGLAQEVVHSITTEGRLEANQQPETWKTPTEGLRTHRRISIEEAKQEGAKVILQTQKDLERMP